MAYWWNGDQSERYWVEIRKVPGIGTGLVCPDVQSDGRLNSWYELVASVKPGELVYHYNAVESRFVGRSEIAGPAVHAHGDYQVPLADFTPIIADVSLAVLRARVDELYAMRDDLQLKFPGEPLHLPFQFKQDRSKFATMSNYFAKLPLSMQQWLFGPDGLASSAIPVAPASVGEAPASEDDPTKSVAPIAGGFLKPFKPKSDSEYAARIRGGRVVRTRRHEALVNSASQWLVGQGFAVGRNAAVDLGVMDPSVIIEAKTIKNFANAIREAVGQLYEYRFFKVADPKSGLIFLSEKKVPDEWVRYLESDRQIGVMWPIGGAGFHLSKLAKKCLGL